MAAQSMHSSMVGGELTAAWRLTALLCTRTKYNMEPICVSRYGGYILPPHAYIGPAPAWGAYPRFLNLTGPCPPIVTIPRMVTRTSLTFSAPHHRHFSISTESVRREFD